MKITKQQLRKIIRESFRTADGGNRPPWVDDPLPAPKPAAPRARRIDPAQAFRRLQTLAYRAGREYAADNPDGDGAAGIEDVARDLAQSALWNVSPDDINAAQQHLRHDEWDVGGQVDLLDMLKDSVAEGAYSIGG